MSQSQHSEPQAQLHLSLSLTPAQEQDILSRITEHLIRNNAQLHAGQNNFGTLSQGETYTASNVKPPSARQAATQARRAKWQRTYLKLKKQHPHQSDTWIATRIAKLDIADGRDMDTIRKNMKPKTPTFK